MRARAQRLADALRGVGVEADLRAEDVEDLIEVRRGEEKILSRHFATLNAEGVEQAVQVVRSKV